MPRQIFIILERLASFVRLMQSLLLPIRPENITHFEHLVCYAYRKAALV
jgi:hypothetical protein